LLPPSHTTYLFAFSYYLSGSRTLAWRSHFRSLEIPERSSQLGSVRTLHAASLCLFPSDDYHPPAPYDISADQPPKPRSWLPSSRTPSSASRAPSTTPQPLCRNGPRPMAPPTTASLPLTPPTSSSAKPTGIVNYDWFDDKLRLSSRVTETRYLWPTIDAEQLKQEAKDAKAAEREQKRAEKEKERKKKEAESINWGAALMQHTNAVARVEDSSEDEESSEEDSSAEQNKSLAQQFAKGAKQAKQDLMSENHHIYMDQTGFVYDVVVTKASVELSRLEKASIILYETNAGPPHYYSVVVKIPEKTSIDDYDLTTVHNVNFPTAFKCLRDNFKVLTGASWDNRIKKFSDGVALAPLPRPSITVTPPSKTSPPGKLSKITKKGKSGKEPTEVEETPEMLQQRLETAFAAQKYRYRLPVEGEPRGTMPDGSHYLHQNKKSVYDLFGKLADRSAEILAAKEAKKEEIKRLSRMALKRQNQQIKSKPEVITIESDDEEEETAEEESGKEESEEEEVGDEEMEDGYVAVNAAGKDVEMQSVDSVDVAGHGAGVEAAEEDFTMVDAPTAQT
ncbi:hypothetical protein KCV06_g602, partial [Aureobasidium melanogenum]